MKRRAIQSEPASQASQKMLNRVDTHCRNFIAISPLCVFRSASVNKQANSSPSANPPGLVKALDEKMPIRFHLQDSETKIDKSEQKANSTETG